MCKKNLEMFGKKLQKSSMILSKALLPNISNARAFGFKKFS
jgi:hypothetical protein